MDHVRIASVINALGFRLLDQISRVEHGNVFISPVSIIMALASACSGTRGQTREEIAATLGLDAAEIETVAPHLWTFMATPDTRDYDDNPWSSPTELHLANGLWISKDLSVLASFVATNDVIYHAEINSVDFSDPLSPGAVNDWVRLQTRGKISEIVSKFDPLTALCLVNALYFKGAWVSPFDDFRTHDQPFFLRNGPTIDVPMMVKSGWFLYAEVEGHQLVQLPLGNAECDLCVVLPGVESGTRELTAPLNSDTWESWISLSELRRGTLKLPKFGVDFVTDPGLHHYLSAIGMHHLFDPSQADLSGLFKTPMLAGRPVYVDSIIHKTRLDVDENGVVAAAVTAMAVAGSAMQEEPAAPFAMTVDRPFLCSIRHSATGTMLFVGSIDNPGKPS